MKHENPGQDKMNIQGTHTPKLLSASTLTGDKVVNRAGENLGKIDDIMIDVREGRIGYAVLSFGGVLGMGDKLFAVPWNSLELDSDNKEFVLDLDKEMLENAPGFDKDNWPDFSDREWGTQVHRHYGSNPYWESGSTGGGIR